MYVCMCICMYVCMYVCMHVCMRVSHLSFGRVAGVVGVAFYVCMHACLHVCMYTHTCHPGWRTLLSSIRKSTMIACTHIHKYTHTYMNISTIFVSQIDIFEAQISWEAKYHAYIHIYIHTCLRKDWKGHTVESHQTVPDLQPHELSRHFALETDRQKDLFWP